jgi:hypothetical protein
MPLLNAKRIRQWIVVAVIIVTASLQFQQDTRLTLHPYRGIALIQRSISAPRVVKMRILQIDLAASGIGFKLSPPAGSREVVNQTTLHYLIQEQATMKTIARLNASGALMAWRQ